MMFLKAILGVPGWLRQLGVPLLILAQVMILQFVSLNLTSDSVLSGLEILSLSLSLCPSPTCSLSLSLSLSLSQK